jgi:simple sugar transport system ATP-binding protein
MRGIDKSFPGVRALDGVDFTLRRGEIHALMGQNGAGKSTLIKVLTGVYRHDAGEMRLDGRPIHPRSPQEAQSVGISTVYQEVNLIPDLSLAENIALGRQPRRLGRIDWKRINRRATDAMARLEVNVDVTRPLRSFSIAIQQMAAIARALEIEAKVLVLDEPTSSLDAAEVRNLFGVMQRLKKDGLGIVFITHFLEQVYAISDRITILRNGRFLGEFEAGKLPRLELIAKMIGQDAASIQEMDARRAATASRSEAAPMLSAGALGRHGSIAPFDLEVRPGEVVGFAGLLGSGRTEAARLLFGLDRPTSGKIRVQGRPAAITSPRKAIALGLGFCPEDRRTDGVIAELSVRENIVLALQARRGWFRRLPGALQESLTRRYIKELGISTPDANKPVGQLSGGNQQKVILARWLASEPRLLILDEPTRGIDVGAKVEIERLVSKLCTDGLAIIFISSELEEVVRSSHRVMVLCDRRKAGELEGDAIDLSNIMKMIAKEAGH